MGFPEYEGPVEIRQLSPGVIMVRPVSSPNVPAGQNGESPDPRVATGPHGSAPEELCDRCEMPYRVCECCNICDATCADYCEHDDDEDEGADDAV